MYGLINVLTTRGESIKKKGRLLLLLLRGAVLWLLYDRYQYRV
jgi:hypothetical protein